VVVRRVVPPRGGDRRRLRGFAGLQAGDRVALFMANCPQYLELLYGIWHAGLVAVPINHKLHRVKSPSFREFGGVAAVRRRRSGRRGAGIWREKNPDLRIVSVDDAGIPANPDGDPIAIVARAPDDLAWLFYTSGTTGQPKG
jgi:long-chain acyl-CoA synthetase